MHAASSHTPGNVIVLKLHDRMSPEELQQNGRRLQLSIAPDVPTHLMVEIDGFRHMEPDRLIETLRLIEPFESSLSRVAVIGSRTWIKAWIKAGGLPFIRSVEYFDTSESDQAWNWLNE